MLKIQSFAGGVQENVMFAYQDVIDGIKSLKSSEATPKTLSNCQVLEFWSKKLGFQGYYHLRQSLKREPVDSFGHVSIKLMRQVCEQRLPALNCAYYEFVVLPKGVGFYSRWIGWNNAGEEIRVPRPLQARESVIGLRKMVDYPVYVIESERDLLAWQMIWGATAYIPEDLAKRYFYSSFAKQHLVSDNPPLDIIRNRQGHTDNISIDNGI